MFNFRGISPTRDWDFRDCSSRLSSSSLADSKGGSVNAYLNDGASCQADGVRLQMGTTSVSFDSWTWGATSGVSWEVYLKIHTYRYVSSPFCHDVSLFFPGENFNPELPLTHSYSVLQFSRIFDFASGPLCADTCGANNMVILSEWDRNSGIMLEGETPAASFV